MRVATLGALGAPLAPRHAFYGVGAIEDRRSLLVLALPAVMTLGFLGTLYVLHNRSFRRR